MLSLFIKLFNIASSNKFLNMLSNFFKFIAFQFCLKRHQDFFCVRKFNIVFIKK